MTKNLFLFPLGTTVNSGFVPQLLNLKSWCDGNDSKVLTSIGKMNTCSSRNILCTLGFGPQKPVPDDVEYFILVEPDIIFNEKHMEILSKTKHPFVFGWRSADISNNVIMAGKWDDEYYSKNKKMPLFSLSEMRELEDKEPSREIEVDFASFGFVRIHRSILENMKYPFFRTNIQELDGNTDLMPDDISFCLNCYSETGIRPVIIPGLHILELTNVPIP